MLQQRNRENEGRAFGVETPIPRSHTVGNALFFEDPLEGPMMDRRQFLLRSLLTTAGALVPPSQLWPFRKIFLPPRRKPSMRGYLINLPLEWDALSGLYVIRAEGLKALHKTLLGMQSQA